MKWPWRSHGAYRYRSYIREMIIGSLGENDPTDPFTDGLEILPYLQTISAFEGENRNAGMICDKTTSANKE